MSSRLRTGISLTFFTVYCSSNCGIVEVPNSNSISCSNSSLLEGSNDPGFDFRPRCFLSRSVLVRGWR